MRSRAALWQLLILICLAMPIGTALASAKYAEVGLGGYALALAVGLVVGVACAYVMWATHKIVVSNLGGRRERERSTSQREWYFGAFYLAKIFWILFAGLLGGWASLSLLRLVF